MPTFKVSGFYPVWAADEQDPYSWQTADFSYQKDLDLETLLAVGTYDLVFYYTRSDEVEHRRVT